MPGDLFVSQTFQEGEMQDLALLARQDLRRLMNGAGGFRSHGMVVGGRWFLWLKKARFLRGTFHGGEIAFFGAQAVQRGVSREHDEPGNGVSFAFVVEMGAVPDFHEDILEHVLDLGGLGQQVMGDGVEQAGVEIVELREGMTLTRRYTSEELGGLMMRFV